MTDSVVDIVNVTLDGDDLNDGSHTLLTTDANTSYIIRQVYISGEISSTLPAAINGFVIGDFVENLEGQELMPVSSTMTLDSSVGWPLPSENVVLNWRQESDDYPQQETLYARNGAPVTVTGNAPTETYAGTLASFSESTGNVDSLYSVGSAFYQIYHDNNSVKGLYYWASGGASRTTLATTSYNPMQVDPVTGVACYFSGNSFYKHTPAGGSEVVRASTPNTSWTTYSREYFFMDWLFYIQSNSTTSEICAINVNNGAHCRWYSLDTNASHSVGTRLVVSYDKATDKFHMYRTHNSGDIVYMAVPEETVTELNALGSESTNSYNGTATETTYTGMLAAATRYDLTWSRCILEGSPLYGDRFYFCGRPDGSPTSSTVAEIWSYKPSTTEQTLIWTTSFDAEQTYGFGFKVYEPDLTEINATTYADSPELNIRMVGIKTEV